MKLLDRAKQAAEQAATKAKEGVEDVQTKRELNAAFGDLGTKTFELVDAGGLAKPELDELVAKIRTLKAKLAEDDAPESAEAPASTGPPAMPV
jgi:BMFP domain-containing protein YqiC